MSSKTLYIVDIRFRQNKFDLNKYINVGHAEILSLTPYSGFLLDEIKRYFFTFHEIVSIKKFYKNVFLKYKEFEDIFCKFNELSFLFRDFAFLITFEEYAKQLEIYLKSIKKEGYHICYITDVDAMKESPSFLHESHLFNTKYIDDIVQINNKDKYFYKKNKIINTYNKLKLKRNIFKKIINKYIYKTLLLPYDMTNFSEFFKNLKPIEQKESIDKKQVLALIENLNKNIIDKKDIFFKSVYLKILNKIKDDLPNNDKRFIKIKPFSFLSNVKNYQKVLINKKNNIPNIFIQHGSYLQENIFLKYNEIYPADLNLVFNDFTKNLFHKRGAKKVYSVGSVDFNYKIKEERKKYDFLYIIYCTSYAYSGLQIFSDKNILSVDGFNIYQRHKEMIELFGIKFKDKKICIKIQAGMMTGSMFYIPFLELSKKYKNVNIEFSIPIQKLIPKSKYIISDYFSSEFINRELHYKRDIILFNSAPLILPKETIEDMNKMFILVENVDDLENKIENIEEIVKDQSKYDDIIEYYSSKNCNTKKIVTEILRKELIINKENK